MIAAADFDEGVVRERRATYGDEVQPGSRKAGVFWHTQGSGQSIFMCCYAGKLWQLPWAELFRGSVERGEHFLVDMQLVLLQHLSLNAENPGSSQIMP